MQAMQAPITKEEWIDKAAVATQLNVAERTVLTLVNRIKAEKRRNPESNQVVWMFLKSDVDRYAGERENLATEVVVKPTQAVQLPALPAGNRTEPATAPRPWLTLEEAAEYSGLTKSWLKMEAEASELPITPTGIAMRDMGKHSPGGRWRFHRESLAEK